jgi:hypothetical protein
LNTHADKTQETKSQSVANGNIEIKRSDESIYQFVDIRPEATAQRKLQEMGNNSPQVSQLRAFQEMANNSPQVKQMAQLQAIANDHSALHQQHIQKKENNTGLPDALKTGIEKLSGMSMDDVKVHHNSDKPAQLQAHAYAQGTEIHLASGQEKHLPHEAWHVVQQKQGRVKPTMQMKGKVNVNDDAGLEKEADVMGAKALSLTPSSAEDSSFLDKSGTTQNSLVQRRAVIGIDGGFTDVVNNRKPAETALIADQIVRRFKDQAEFEKFAQGQKLGVAGELKDKTWIRVDQFTILGEKHGDSAAPGIIKALGTNRFRYEGFSHFSEDRKNASDQLKANTEKRDSELNKDFDFSKEQEGQTHEAEHVLPKYARVIPDIKPIAKNQSIINVENPLYVPGSNFKDGYATEEKVIKYFLDALIYAKSYEKKWFGHELKTFYANYKANIDESIINLSEALAVNRIPDLSKIKAVSDPNTFKAMFAAYKKEAMEKTGLNTDEKINEFKKSLENNVVIQADDPDAILMDYLRDHSMLATINEAKSNDLLFIIGYAHQQKLRNKVGDIPIMGDKVFIEKENEKNKQAKQTIFGIEKGKSVKGSEKDKPVEVLENELRHFISIKPTVTNFLKKKAGDEAKLKSLKDFGAQWHINGKVYNEGAQFIWQDSMVVEVWLPPNFVEENSKVKDWLLVWSWSSKNENKNEDSEP